LRTLSPDDEPVIGFDPRSPDFIWAAGLGGFGVQAAFAVGRCCEALLCRDPIGAELANFGVDLARLSPGRLIAQTGAHHLPENHQ
jgi:D-arginine dehydrogenase